MLEFIERESVQFLIVHKVDRLARNRLDDVMISVALEEAGVTLVSCSEAIDKTPAGKLTHGLMALIAEWYSSNLSHEVKTKSLEKVRAGGTVSKAPVGYLNVRRRVNGQEIRTVELDAERAPLVKWAFDQYGSGAWTLLRLTAALEGPDSPIETILAEAPAVGRANGTRGEGGKLETPQQSRGSLADRIRALQSTASRVASN